MLLAGFFALFGLVATAFAVAPARPVLSSFIVIIDDVCISSYGSPPPFLFSKPFPLPRSQR